MARKEHEHPKERRRGGRAAGGRAPEHLYNAKGSPEAEEAENEKEKGFKRGGKAEGKESKERLDKRARGGKLRSHKAHKLANGGSPYSSAHNLGELEDNRGAGHEGEKPGRAP